MRDTGSASILLASYPADRPSSTKERDAPTTFYYTATRSLPPGSETLPLQIIYSAKLKWRTTKFETRAGGFCLCSSDFSRHNHHVLYFLLIVNSVYSA